MFLKHKLLPKSWKNMNLNIECVHLPATCAKQQMNKFVTYHSETVKHDSGKQLEDLEVDFHIICP